MKTQLVRLASVEAIISRFQFRMGFGDLQGTSSEMGVRYQGMKTVLWKV